MLITRGRQQFAQQAFRCFLSQDYPNKRLVIVDDADERSFPYGVDHSLVQYEISPERSIPRKRNMAAMLAEDAEVIAHFDSDDWSDPQRLSAQMHLLKESSLSVTGFHSILFYAELSGQCFRYTNDNSYAVGTTLVYRRQWWMAHPFNERLVISEDNAFVTQARNAGELISVDGDRLVVARIHGDNTSIKNLDGAQTSYRPVSREALPKSFFA